MKRLRHPGNAGSKGTQVIYLCHTKLRNDWSCGIIAVRGVLVMAEPWSTPTRLPVSWWSCVGGSAGRLSDRRRN